MSNIFGVPTVQDQEDNNRKGECEHYLDRIEPSTFYKMSLERDKYYKEYHNCNSKLMDIADNKKLKNKRADFELLARRAKALFNYRSLDYYLYMLGLEPICKSVTKFGIEYELNELFEDTKAFLVMLGQYSGYNSIHWQLGCGHSDWLAADEPDFPEKDEYTREDLGVLLA